MNPSRWQGLRAAFFGRRAERRAARWLRRHGLRILARNLRVGRDEIDLLAADGALLIVVEVRMRRSGWLDADRSVDRAKEERLRRAIRRLARERRWPRGTAVRGDLVLVDGADRILHLPAALWRGEGA